MTPDDIEEYAVEALDEAACTIRSTVNMRGAIARAAQTISDAIDVGGKVLICGNGGSAAMADHMAAELVGRFKITREPLPAISMSANPATLTALANDFGFQSVFASQILGLCQPNDIVVVFTTSGLSHNIDNALFAAKQMRAKSIAITGPVGIIGNAPVDIQIRANGDSSAAIQQVHLVILHIICGLVERMVMKEEVAA